MKTGKNGLYFEAENLIRERARLMGDTSYDIGTIRDNYALGISMQLKKRNGDPIKKSTARRYVREYLRRHGTVATKLRAIYTLATSNLPFFK